MTALWRAQFYPHSGRWLVSDGDLAVFGTLSIASFATWDQAESFAEARNLWEGTCPRPEDFGGSEPFPEPSRYEFGRAIFDRALR